MKRLVLLALLLAAFAGSPLPATAQGSLHVNGGGTATGADTSSQFGMGVLLDGNGAASGQFTCVMAGRSAMTSMGLSLMAVQGPVTTGMATLEGATFGGIGTVTMNTAQSSNRQELTEAFTVTVTPGGAGSGTLSLDVPGLGFSMTETITSGQITVH